VGRAATGNQKPSGSPRGRQRRLLVTVGATAVGLALSVGTAHAVFGSLHFVEEDRDGVGGVDGLFTATGVAASPDGAHVYVTGQSDDAVAAFSRDPSTGALTFVEQEKDGVGGVDGLDGAWGVASSPDGAHVYVASLGDSAVATFSRDSSSGTLTFVEQDKDGVGGVDGIGNARGVAVTPNGTHVYVVGQGDDAIATFSRDPSTGALDFVEQDKDGVGGVDGLNSAFDVAVSPNLAHVYATGLEDDAVATFLRDPSTGALAFVEQDKDGVGGVDGLDGAWDVASSPDGAHVYATGFADSAVATFSRDPSTGSLTFVEQDKDGVGEVQELAAARGVTVAPDGAHVYVTGFSDDAVTTFSRDSSSGALSFIEHDKDGFASVDGIDGAVNVAASPDGANAYVTGSVDSAVATFSRERPAPEAGTADTDPPETTITKGPRGKTKKRKAKFKFTSDEPGSTFQCKLDKKPFVPCAPPFKKKVKRKKHKFQVRAIDPAGNVDPTPAKRKWKVKKAKRKKKT
jgi:6-phosphogluconolactonase (cycloisomerase 2 family)